MRVTNRLFVLGAVLLLLSGSIISTNEVKAVDPSDLQTTFENLLLKQERDLEDFRLELQQAGDELFAEKQAELRRAQAQRLHNDTRALQAQLTQEYQQIKDVLSGELLRQQLQLMLVTLDERQQETCIAHIAELQEQMTAAQARFEEDYENQLLKLQTEHEKWSHQEIADLQTEVEQALEAEFTDYQLALLKELEEQVAKMRLAGRSETINR